MKKITRLILVLLLVLTVGWLTHQWWKSRQSIDAWACIPDHAVLILEVQSPLEWLTAHRPQAVWTPLTTLPYTQQLLQRLKVLQTTGQSLDHDLDDFWKGRPLTVSLHVTARDDFDYLFYVPLRTPADQRWAKQLLGRFQQDATYQTSTHTFQDFRITEIRASGSPLLFSYIIHQNYLIGSYTPFLVEDAVRTLGERNLLNARWESMQRVPTPAGNGEASVRLHVNVERLPQWATVFAKPNQADFFRSLSHAAQSGEFSLRSDNDQIRLVGKLRTRSGDRAADWLDIFRDQPAVPMRLTGLIPNETAVLYHWGFQDAPRLRDALTRYAIRHDSAMVQRQMVVRENYGVRLSPVYDWMGREMALALLNNTDSTANRLIFVATQELDKAIIQLNDLASAVDRRNATDPYTEQYANVTIRQIGIPEFPVCAFGSLFEDFPQCFYAPVNGYIVFSNHVAGLKHLLDQIAAEEVWYHSVKQRAFLQQTTPDANFSVFVHAPNAWDVLLPKIYPRWQQQFSENLPTLRPFEQVALQITRKGDGYQTSLMIENAREKTALVAENEFFVNRRITFDQPLRSQAFVVKNPVDQSSEILVQDQANQLHFVSGAGQRIGQKPLDGPLVSAIYPVDARQRGTPDFVFATQHKLGLLDRKGFWVPGFPVALPDSARLHTLGVVDYDKSGAYRFVVSDVRGNLYIFDKTGTLLDGWKPRRLDYPLSAPVQHVRVAGRDCLLACQANGVIQVLNRRGESYPGFPIHLKTRLSSPIVVETGLTSESTLLTLVTDYGERVQLDLTGRIRQREQWYRPDREATFRLFPEASGKGWIVLRQSSGKVAVLDTHGSAVFETSSGSSRGAFCQYYDFGTNRKVFALTFPDKRQTFLYDGAGKLIGNRAVESQFPVSVVYSEAFSKLLVYRANGPEAGIWTVKIR